MASSHCVSLRQLAGLLPSALLFLGQGAAAVPHSHSKRVSETTYDYIIVGGGVAGLVVANRLSEDPSRKVLVVEYGHIDNSSTTLWPYFAQGLGVNPDDIFGDIVSTPQSVLGNATFNLYVGSVVGGGSIVNGMAYDRGMQSDYNSWSQLGSTGWDWTNLLTYFKKSTTFTPNTAADVELYNYTWNQAAYGKGPVQATLPPFQYPELPTFWKATEELNITKREEGALGAPGAFWIPATIDPVLRTRSSARTAYYDPIAKRTNLQLLTGCYVQDLILTNTTVNGVNIISRSDNTTIRALAKKEVILAAGAVHTPQILQLNGIGPASVLKAAGIDVLVDLPGVGANFQDHPVAYMSYDLTNDTSFPQSTSLSTNATYNETSYEQYITNRTGPYTRAHDNSGTFLPLKKIAPDTYSSIASALAAEDATAYLPALYKENPTLLAGYLAQRKLHIAQITSDTSSIYEHTFGSGGSATTALQKPISRGTILLNPANPRGEPIVDFNALVNPSDQAVMLASIRYTRKFFNTTALSVYAPVEVSPGAALQTDEELLGALAAGLGAPSFAHPCGTAALMPKKYGGVVAADLKVYGMKKLSVVDASIMPMIPSTHLQATVYAIGEKAADIIKARAS